MFVIVAITLSKVSITELFLRIKAKMMKMNAIDVHPYLWYTKKRRKCRSFEMTSAKFFCVKSIIIMKTAINKMMGRRDTHANTTKRFIR